MSDPDLKPDWVAVDRRSGSYHAWAMQGATMLAERRIADGSDAALLTRIEDWLAAGARDVVQCGGDMLVSVPIKPGELALQPCADLGGARAWMLPGLKQTTPTDMMTGAETSIAGFLALNPNWDGVICLPGLHTHWAQISADEIVSFQSYLSFELFAALGVASLPPLGDGFATAVTDAMSRPQQMAQQLNAARAGMRIGALTAEAAANRMLGTLLGAELAGARPYWLGQQIALIGPPDLTAPYKAALDLQAAMVTVAQDTRMTLAGLTAAWRRLPDQAAVNS